ncbi:MAG: arginine--tRNA ligase [Patescibacteria group bacterium]
MYTLDAVKQHITDILNRNHEEAEINPAELVYPPNPEYGDLSLPCFNLARKLKRSPGEMAETLLSKLSNDEIISGAATAGAYLNFFINKKFLAENIIKEILEYKNNYGENEHENGKKVMLEYSNANTHKEYHIGHLRNISYGDAVTRILKANGCRTVPVSYINDFGIHVAKTLWNYKGFIKENYGNEQELEKLPPADRGKVLGEIYADAVYKEKESPTAKQMIGGIMKQIESGQGEEYDLWKKTRQWNIKQFDRIYQELGVEFEKIYYEHEFIGQGMKKVEELLEKGILTKSEGAIIADLQKYDLGVLVFIRSDGTAMYPVADIPLAEQKIKDFNPDDSLYVVDIRQSLYFSQLFKVLELMGYSQNYIHLTYDFVKLPDGMMSSRTGNIITYKELKDKLTEQSVKETRQRHPDWPEEKIQKTASTLALSAMKFEMLKVEAGNTITFDIAKALSFEGFTAAYIQYTFARLSSILAKAEKVEEKADHSCLQEEREKDLLLKLSKYPETVKRAGKNYAPNEIAKYLFDLTKTFNDYYHNISILQSEEKTKQARLHLARSINQTIKNGLHLLGINTTEEM